MPRCFLLFACLLVLVSPAFTQNTTYTAETSNNTSACPSSGTLPAGCRQTFSGLNDHCGATNLSGDSTPINGQPAGNFPGSCSMTGTNQYPGDPGPPTTPVATNTQTTTTVAKAGNVSKINFKNLLYPGTPLSQVTTKIVCHTQLWWGTSSHIASQGQVSTDTSLITREAQNMIDRGCDVVAEDWYGANGQPQSTAMQAWLTELDGRCSGGTCPLYFAMNEDAGTATRCDGCDITVDNFETDLDYVYRNYMNHTSYWKVNDKAGCNSRPVFLSFGVQGTWGGNASTNFGNVKSWIHSSLGGTGVICPGEPVLASEGEAGLSDTNQDGAYNWIGVDSTPQNYYDNSSPGGVTTLGLCGTGQYNAHLTTSAPCPGPQGVGTSFLSDDWLAVATQHAQQPVIIASVYAGFNDTNADWGWISSSPQKQGRKVARECGNVWVQSWGRIALKFPSTNQIPAVGIPTWDDYEEGSAIEPGIENCGVLTDDPSSGTTYTFHIRFNSSLGSENTIDHYDIYYSTDGTVGENLTFLQRVNVDTTKNGDYSITLPSTLPGAQSSAQIYVKMVGMPSIINLMTPKPGRTYTPSGCTAQISATPSSLAFGGQKVGTTSGAQSVTVTNNSACSVTVSKSTTGDFSASGCATSVAAGGSCSLSVTFAPIARGTRTGTLTVTGTAGSSTSTQSVSLSGTGTQALISLSPASLSFANQQVNTTSASQAVTLTNTGDAALTISSITIGADFLQNNNCPVSPSTLALNASCTVNVSFRPTTYGAISESLTVSGDAANSPQSISLSGTGFIIVSGLDDQTWSACSGSCDNAYTQLVGSPAPALDGQSREYHFGSVNAWSSAVWTIQPGIGTNAVHYDYDFYLDMTNPGASQALEFSVLQRRSNRSYPFQLQCDFGGTGYWRVWNPPTQSWTQTNRTCVRPTGGWDHFILRVERLTGRTDLCGSGNCLYYKELVINGTTYPMYYPNPPNPPNTPIYLDSISETGTDYVSIGVRLVGNGTPTPYSIFIDTMQIQYW